MGHSTDGLPKGLVGGVPLVKKKGKKDQDKKMGIRTIPKQWDHREQVVLSGFGDMGCF